MSFARPTPEQHRQRNAERRAENLRVLCNPVRNPRGSYGGTTTGRPISKDDAVRSEAYRRLVAARPCKHCGRVGRSQAAHPPPEGKSLKHDDRMCFPLCCDELMRRGCHPRFDNYELFTHEVALAWAARWAFETRAEILAAGEWPAGLELFDEATA